MICPPFPEKIVTEFELKLAVTLPSPATFSIVVENAGVAVHAYAVVVHM